MYCISRKASDAKRHLLSTDAVVLNAKHLELTIWEQYEKEAEKHHKGISKQAGFKYPPILPIVYYEGSGGWTVPLNLCGRIMESHLFKEFLPDFRYYLVPLRDYSNEELMEHVVKSEKFSEIIQEAMNRYLNGMLTNEQVIEELLNLAKQIAAAQKEGEQLGLTADELAFYDALTKPQAIKDFYENEELIAITKELADTLRKNRTIDWQKRDSARAKMRMMIKKLLKKHKYPPEGMDDAVQTVMTQCELWTDNNDMGRVEENVVDFKKSTYTFELGTGNVMMVAEGPVRYEEE